RWFARDGVVVEGNGIGASHAKWASADGSVMVLGSQNLDSQSWKRARERGVAIDDPATTQKFDTLFDQIFDSGAVAYEPPRSAQTSTSRDVARAPDVEKAKGDP